MSEQLGERQAAILRALVREYINSGEPVGSQHLVARARIQASPATVRNEMARLEELGYLAQPHTSAGRIPTGLAYRFIVDEIKAPKQLAAGQQRALAQELHEGEPGSIDELLHRASEVVARSTKHASAVLASRGRPSTLRRLELFPTGARVAMLVLIAENGRVEQRMIPTERVADDEIERIANRLSSELHGVVLEKAMKTLQEDARGAAPAEKNFLHAIGAALKALLDSEEQVVVGGTANLASEQDFERETLTRMYEALEHQTAVLKLLAGALDAPLSVRIGAEVPSEEFQSCSLVIASFGGEGEARGSVGVIGPIRMDYERVIATANAVARLLEGTLSSGSISP